MNFYSEWEARHRYEEHLRTARRREAWHLESGLLPHEEGRGVSGFFRRLFGAPVDVTVGDATPHVVDHASTKDHKKAS